MRALALVGGVAALVVCAGTLVTRPAHHNAVTATSTPVLPGTVVTAASTGSSGQPDPGTTAPLPYDLTSARVSGVAVPVSASDGPYHRTGGLASGFNHDRAGAVLAATNLLLRLTPQVGPAVFTPTLHTQVSGPNAAAMTEQVTAQYQQLCSQARIAPGGPVGTLTATFVGYQIQLYNDTTALLTVLTEADRTGQAPLYAGSVIQLRWVNGDWTLVAPTGGVWDQSVTQVAADDVSTFNPVTAGR